MAKVRFEGLEYTVFGLETEMKEDCSRQRCYVAVRTPFEAGETHYSSRTIEVYRNDNPLVELAGEIVTDADNLLGRGGYRYLDVQLSFDLFYATKVTEKNIFTAFPLTAEEQRHFPKLVQQEYINMVEMIPRLLAEEAGR